MGSHPGFAIIQYFSYSEQKESMDIIKEIVASLGGEAKYYDDDDTGRCSFIETGLEFDSIKIFASNQESYDYFSTGVNNKNEIAFFARFPFIVIDKEKVDKSFSILEMLERKIINFDSTITSGDKVIQSTYG